MFAKTEMDFEIEAAFAGAREILQRLSLQSAQAAHYFEILTLLSDAITKQRQKKASQANRSRSRYVGRIFSLDSRSPPTEMRPDTDLDVDSISSAGSGRIPDAWMQNDRCTPLQMQQDLDGGEFLGWDSLNLPLWDSFPFMSEPFIGPG